MNNDEPLWPNIRPVMAEHSYKTWLVNHRAIYHTNHLNHILIIYQPYIEYGQTTMV